MSFRWIQTSKYYVLGWRSFCCALCSPVQSFLSYTSKSCDSFLICSTFSLELLKVYFQGMTQASRSSEVFLGFIPLLQTFRNLLSSSMAIWAHLDHGNCYITHSLFIFPATSEDCLLLSSIYTAVYNPLVSTYLWLIFHGFNCLPTKIQKYYKEHSRNKYFLSFNLGAILTSVVKPCTLAFHSASMSIIPCPV